jgi:hypothetical protein
VLRQSYARVGQRALIRHQRHAHAKQFRRANKALRRLRTILGRVIRDILRKTAARPDFAEIFACPLALARREGPAPARAEPQGLRAACAGGGVHRQGQSPHAVRVNGMDHARSRQHPADAGWASGAETMSQTIATIGIDLGKHTFHLIGFDPRGAIVLRQKRSRTQLEQTLANCPPCLIGMEACSGAHHLGRRLAEWGHDVRLLPAQYVRPFLKGHKNDYRDAEAIAEAVQRPTMRFWPAPMRWSGINVSG